ncbi:MAG: HAMP domain-containing sensor histidine kinase [Bdellovibrio sp.]
MLISGRVEAYEAFQASHLELRKSLKALLEDPKFGPYASEIKKVADLEKQAESMGRGQFIDRVNKRIPVEQVARELSKTGLPFIKEMHDRLKHIEHNSLKNWQETSRSIQNMQTRSRDLIRVALIAIAVLMLMLVLALWAILRQRNLLDEKQNKIFEKEQIISRARKSAVEIVAHDLRSPLASIQMCLESLEEAEEEERGALFQIGKGAALSALNLINQILDHAKIENNQMCLEKTNCDLKMFLDDQIKMYMTICLSKNVQLVSQVARDIPHCLCDTLRVGQVLSNLIGNALKFSPAGCVIRLTVDHRGNEVLFTVTDEGPGIEPTQAERLFEQYWQGVGPTRGAGIGLGLSISKSIVDAHGGRIWVVSSVGKGSSFHFSLPLVD